MKVKVFIWQLEEEKVDWGWFIQSFLHFILFAENFILVLKEPLYSACLNLNHGKTK